LEEVIFAVPETEIWNLLTYKEQGLICGNSDSLQRIAQNGLFLRRSELEEDPSFKQIFLASISGYWMGITFGLRPSKSACCQ
jgi:hypothetical protein